MAGEGCWVPELDAAVGPKARFERGPGSKGGLLYTIFCITLRIYISVVLGIAMETQALFSFRVTKPFVDETTQSAKLAGLSRSEYARRAIEEMNHRVMRERIAVLSKQLSAESRAVNKALDDTTEDGLHA